MSSRHFWQLGLLAGMSGLLSCGSADAPAQKQAQVPAATQSEPSVLVTTRHYLRLLTQATPPPTDSLTHYRGLVAQADVLPGRSLLRLPTYTVVVQPDPLYPRVTIEPAARTELYNPLAAAVPITEHAKKPVQVVLAARKANPALAVSLPELVANFGKWRGDDYAPVEEPLEPDMHTTEILYRNAATGQLCRIAVRLRDAPQTTANVVHDIQFARTHQSP